jgi:hypothetical protein
MDQKGDRSARLPGRLADLVKLGYMESEPICPYTGKPYRQIEVGEKLELGCFLYMPMHHPHRSEQLPVLDINSFYLVTCRKHGKAPSKAEEAYRALLGSDLPLVILSSGSSKTLDGWYGPLDFEDAYLQWQLGRQDAPADRF